jgi:ankyrin repeat protein
MATRSEETLADEFVGLVHDDPQEALVRFERSPRLARATASWGETALQAASHLGQRHLLAGFMEAGAVPDIFAACALGDMRAAEAFLPFSRPGVLGVHRLPLLHFAVVSRDPAMLDMLLDAGVALHPRGASLSPLHSAVAAGSVPMIRALVEAGVDRSMTDAFGATALDWAYDVEDKGSILAVLLSGYLRRATEDLPTAG